VKYWNEIVFQYSPYTVKMIGWMYGIKFPDNPITICRPSKTWRERLWKKAVGKQLLKNGL